MKKIIQIILLVNLLTLSVVYSRVFKLASLAPEGTTLAEELKKFSKEVKEKTKNRVVIRLYLGGVRGDEQDVLRKIRVKQMDGGIFTGKTLGIINGDVRVMEVPFTFDDRRDIAWKVLQDQKVKSFFNSGFEKNGFKNLGFLELGLVYLISTKKIDSFASLKGKKIWVWSGDELSSTIVKKMNLVSVTLSLPDVLPSLNTGIVETAYAHPIGILALQWHTKVGYLIKFPITYAIGACLIRKDGAWNKISKQDQKVIEELAHKHLMVANNYTIKENVDALKQIKTSGVSFVSFPQQDIRSGIKIRNDVVKELQGKLFSQKAYQMVDQKVKEFMSKVSAVGAVPVDSAPLKKGSKSKKGKS